MAFAGIGSKVFCWHGVLSTTPGKGLLRGGCWQGRMLILEEALAETAGPASMQADSN